MTFSEFLGNAWSKHNQDPQKVADEVIQGIPLAGSASDIPQLAQLITHVCGEHLGQWQKGIGLLRLLEALPFYESGGESGNAIRRSVACLELASGQLKSVEAFSPSDRIRILAIAGSALSGQGDTGRALAYFQNAIEIGENSIAKGDPANRALAVMGNNLACTLEEKPHREPKETELMILAAQTGRRFWEISGTWLEVERAEYRLSQSYLQAGDPAASLRHARLCLEIAEKNQAPALEFFFGHEAVALAELALGNHPGFARSLQKAEIHFSHLSAEDQSWCEATLTKLRSRAEVPGRH